MSTIIQELSQRFSVEVRKALTADELEEVITLDDNNPGSCNVDECVDSNMLVDDAFTNLIGHELDPASEEDVGLFNAAWQLSVENGYVEISTYETQLKAIADILQCVANDNDDFFGMLDDRLAELMELHGLSNEDFDFSFDVKISLVRRGK